MKLTYNFQKFSAKDYLKEYYPKFEKLDRDYLDFMHGFYKRLNLKSARMLEIGGGPTIDQLISASGKVKKIIFSEYLPDNLREVRGFVKNTPNGFNWDKHFAYVAKLENKGQDTEELKQRVRNKIKKIISCDLNKKIPVKVSGRFDVVSVNFCPESITDQEAKYLDYLRKIFDYIKSGGWLVMCLLRQSTAYDVKGFYFPAFPVSRPYITNVLRTNGFINLKIKEVVFRGKHNKGMFRLFAQKKK
ncbi:MAG: methyltransferase domain-containing protein [Candidatus Komeilibacteria bacterium]|nr:methyltransferase domain-containing protein [Candidatus Komeilibacteria bacterium]